MSSINQISEEQMMELYAADMQEDKKWRTFFRIFVIVALIVIILLIIFLPCHCNCDKGEPEGKNPWDMTLDDDITDDDGRSKEVDDLNKMVEDGMITISMNADPVFENGSAKGSLSIENDKSNKRPQIIQIYKDSDGELIYTSGLIPVGKFLNSAALDVKLPKGDYKCTAYFNAMNEDGTIAGTAGANITIHILN